MDEMRFGARGHVRQVVQFLAPIDLHVVPHAFEVVPQMHRKIRGLEKPVRREDDREICRPHGLYE